MLTELTTCTTADGIMLDGALYAAPRPAPSAAQVLVVHGLGWNFYQGPSRWLPPRLAAMGYSTLSMNMRDHDLKEPKDFDLAFHDLRAGVDFLYGHGAKTVVVLGHGYACNKIVRYAALSGDRRIRHWVLTTMGSVKRLKPEIWFAGLDLAAQMAGHILVVQGAVDASLEGPGASTSWPRPCATRGSRRCTLKAATTISPTGTRNLRRASTHGSRAS